jgi:signal transduction histidine kinase
VKHQDLARVFDPYFTTKRTGSGLGLAIAKNIVEGMGGSVALESQPGVGTEIRLDIPIHQVGLSAPPAKESALAHHSARRVGGA